MAPPSVKKYGGKKTWSHSRSELVLNTVFTQNFFEQKPEAAKKRERPKKVKTHIGELPTPDDNRDLLNDSESELHVNRLDDTFDRLKHRNGAYNHLQKPKLSTQEEHTFKTEAQRTEDSRSSISFDASYENDKFYQMRERSVIISKNSCGNGSQDVILPATSIQKSTETDLSQDNHIPMNESIGKEKKRHYLNKCMVSSTPITKSCRNNLIQSSSSSPALALNDLTNLSTEEAKSLILSLDEVSMCANNTLSTMSECRVGLRPRSKSVSYIDGTYLKHKSRVTKRKAKVIENQDSVLLHPLSKNQSSSKLTKSDKLLVNNSTPKHIKNVNVIRKNSNISVITGLDFTDKLNPTVNEFAVTAGKTCNENVSQANNFTPEDLKNVIVVRKKSNITVTELDSIDNSIPIGNDSVDTEKGKTCQKIVPKRRSTRRRSDVFQSTLRDYIYSPDLFASTSDECDNCDNNKIGSLTHIENTKTPPRIKRRKHTIDSKTSVKQALDSSPNCVPSTSGLNSIGTHKVDRTNKLWESSVSDFNETTKRDKHLRANQIEDVVDVNSSHLRRRRKRREGVSADKMTKSNIGHGINQSEPEDKLASAKETSKTFNAFTSVVSVDSMHSSAQEGDESDVDLILYLTDDDVDFGEENQIFSVPIVKGEVNDDSNDIVLESGGNATTTSGNLLNCKDATIFKINEEINTEGEEKLKGVKSRRRTRRFINYMEDTYDSVFESSDEERKTKGKIKSKNVKPRKRIKSLSKSVKSKHYNEDSNNTVFGSSDNPTITPGHLLNHRNRKKEELNTDTGVKSKAVAPRRRSKSLSQSAKSENYKKESKDIAGENFTNIPENSAGSHENSVLAIAKVNIPKRRRRALSVHTVINNEEENLETPHAQVAEPIDYFVTGEENDGISKLHPASNKKEVAYKPRTPVGRFVPNRSKKVSLTPEESHVSHNYVENQIRNNASDEETNQELPSPSPKDTFLGNDEEMLNGGESDVIDFDTDELADLKSPPKCNKRFTYAKPFALAPGKSWRRSLAAIKRNTITAAGLAAQRCSCADCAIVNLDDSSVGRKTIFSLSSTPAQPRKSSGDTEYEQNRLREAVALENFIENISLNVSHLGVRDNQRHYPSARQLVLQRCKQGGPLKFSKWYPETLLRNCHKIGEGVYGEVFLYRNVLDGTTTVMKVIPIEGEMLVNGERQKQFEEILSEIVIASELSNLRSAARNQTTGFNQLKNVRCVKGKYPQRLIELWELYEESKGTDNDNPNMFGADQLYIVLELANAGNDLESFVFTNFSEVYHVFLQIALTLAVGEEELQFEHRDLHWGNVLISRVPKDKVCTYKLNGDSITVPTNSVEASIIDFTLSRITCDKISFYNDLSQDPDLFNAEGDYQFEIYKLMQIANGNNWEPFQPKTNILWLHYVLVKMTTAVHMIKKSVTAKNKKYFHLLVDWENSILKYKSAKEFVEEAIKPLYRSK